MDGKSRIDKRIIPQSWLPLHIKTEAQLLELGKENLAVLQEIWTKERKSYMRRRDKEKARKWKNDRTFQKLHDEIERFDGYIALLNRLMKKAESRPYLPIARPFDHLRERVYLLIDSGAFGLEFVPAWVQDVSGNGIAWIYEERRPDKAHPVSVRSANAFNVAEMNFLVNNTGFAKFVSVYYKESEQWLDALYDSFDPSAFASD